MKRILLAMTTAVLALGIYAIPPGTNDEIAERLKPAGSVCRTGEGCGSSAVAVATGSMSGEEIYKQFCFVCHATGVSDAPRLGDTDAWQPRVDKGVETLVTTTLNGLNAMPPKGTCMSCSDDELGSAVTYMLDQL